MTPRAHQDNTARAAKSVHLIPGDSEIKTVCFDDETQSLRPNLVLVDAAGSVVFEINELGLKGAARDPSRKLAVVWGDSVVFGISWSWPCLLDGFAPGYQFLNGGIEADPYNNILRRAAEFNRAHAVALNVLMLGWHPVPSTPTVAGEGLGTALRRLAGRLRPARSAPPAIDLLPRRDPQYPQLRAALLAFLQSTPNTVLVTNPTPLNRKIVDQDLSQYFTGGGRNGGFSFAGYLPYSVERQRFVFAHIATRNAIVREVAQATGVRLIDLAVAFDTEALADFRADFHDVIHLRPRAYPKAAAAIYAGIKDLL
jgi:hypothetical protein